MSKIFVFGIRGTANAPEEVLAAAVKAMEAAGATVQQSSFNEEEDGDETPPADEKPGDPYSDTNSTPAPAAEAVDETATASEGEGATVVAPAPAQS